MIGIRADHDLPRFALAPSLQRFRARSANDGSRSDCFSASRSKPGHDAEGCDWEFVEYLSDAPDERHDYALPD